MRFLAPEADWHGLSRSGVQRPRAAQGWLGSRRAARLGSQKTSLALGRCELPLPDTLHDIFPRSGGAVEPTTCPPIEFRTGNALIRLEPGSSFASVWGIAARQP